MNRCPEYAIDSNGHLLLGGNDLWNLAEKYGTPLFAFDETRLRDNYKRFAEAFTKNFAKVIVCYSIKTNYNLTLCRIIREQGAHAEIASELDLYVAKRTGFPPTSTILDGLYKPERLLREAITSKILLINIESLSELYRIDSIAKETGVTQSVGIRVNFSKTRKIFTAEGLFCKPERRFGFLPNEAFKALEKAKKLQNVEIAGIMTHPYRHSKELLQFVRMAEKNLAIRFQYINFGGGFRSSQKIDYSHLVKDLLRQKVGLNSKLDRQEMGLDLEKIGVSIAHSADQLLGDISTRTIVFEPGSFIVGDAGILLLRVECIKKTGNDVWVVTDGGTNLIPDFWERRKIVITNRASSLPSETVNVVGPLLYAHDFVAIKQKMPKVYEGDTIAVFNAGAYTLSNFNQFLFPRPAAVLVDSDGGIRKIREKEANDDVLAMDEVMK